MTAVANPPVHPHNLNRPGWGGNGGQMNNEDVRSMFIRPKNIQRTNSSSSLASNNSNASNSSSSTLVSSNGSANGAPVSAAGDLSGWPNPVAKKRPQPKGQWVGAKSDGQSDLPRLQNGRSPMGNSLNGMTAVQQHGFLPPGSQMSQGPPRPLDTSLPPGQPVLYLLSLNGTFERKTIAVPFQPDALRIGRQTNIKTIPTSINGFFDSKVLSRQHAEVYADRQGKIWIRDIKSSNGTFVNGTRLSAENRESEPHELQTSDHLELGIDIVSEDQKSVVHHKVAAKVEHAGFVSPSSSLLDMSFGDLDPTNGSMMVPQSGGATFRRTASQGTINGNQRVPPVANPSGPANNLVLQRGLMMTSGPTTEAIVKRLHTEIRNARLQAQDIARTKSFIDALISKDDVKDDMKATTLEHANIPYMVNGNTGSFRSDVKTRFSDPPAPPPQQPLPEKPSSVRGGDLAGLKRATTEKPKVQPPPNSVSPSRQENFSQILQLTEALNTAKKEIDTQHARMRDLEEMLYKERHAREVAEETARKLEDAASSLTPSQARELSPTRVLEEAFEPSGHSTFSKSEDEDEATPDATPDATAESAVEDGSAESHQARIEALVAEVQGLRSQMEDYRGRAEKAEADRDADRDTLAEMVRKIRQRDEDDARRKAEQARSVSRGRTHANGPVGGRGDGATSSAKPQAPEESTDDAPTLSRANTITPSQGELTRASVNPALVNSAPYASVLGVVILGMGLMAYINGWQPQPRSGH